MPSLRASASRGRIEGLVTQRHRVDLGHAPGGTPLSAPRAAPALFIMYSTEALGLSVLSPSPRGRLPGVQQPAAGVGAAEEGGAEVGEGPLLVTVRRHGALVAAHRIVVGGGIRERGDPWQS